MKHRLISSRRRWFCAAAAIALACADVAPRILAAASPPAKPAKKPAPPETLFWIGRPDASAMEFGAARPGWRAFTKTFPKPIVFRVGTDKPSAWPFLHPSTADDWAGGRAHTFTVEFNVAQLPQRPELFLIIGLVNAYSIPSQLTVTINGQEAGVQRVPAGNASGDAAEFTKLSPLAFTLPEKSVLLLAPLSEQAGGWGLCQEAKSGQKMAVFASPDDPDYQALLALCAGGKNRLDEIKRFDMPGFRPRPDWVREMKRYGVLAADLKPADPIDIYATEQRYWQSLWPQPSPAVARGVF